MGVVGLQLIDLLLLEANVHEANMRRLISLNVRSVVPSGALTMPRSVHLQCVRNSNKLLKFGFATNVLDTKRTRR